jgi:hypothetical protein
VETEPTEHAELFDGSDPPSRVPIVEPFVTPMPISEVVLPNRQVTPMPETCIRTPRIRTSPVVALNTAGLPTSCQGRASAVTTGVPSAIGSQVNVTFVTDPKTEFAALYVPAFSVNAADWLHVIDAGMMPETVVLSVCLLVVDAVNAPASPDATMTEEAAAAVPAAAHMMMTENAAASSARALRDIRITS